MAVVVKLVNTTDCGSVIRPFESGQPPHKHETSRITACFFMCYNLHMMKKVLLSLLLVLSITACQQEQPTQENNGKNACDATKDCGGKKKAKIKFTEISMQDALDIFANQESAILYFGFENCPYCQEAAPLLKEAADQTGKEILYVKTRDDKNNELLYDDQQRQQLIPYIGSWMEENEEKGNVLWLYVPLVVRVENGVATNAHSSTLPEHDPEVAELTTEQKEQLRNIYLELLQ